MKEQLEMINQLVLAAADLDQQVFRENILPAFNNVGARRTLYASDDDNALNISEILRDVRPRVGCGGNRLFIADQIDTIDSTPLTATGDSHGYIFQKKELLQGLYYLLHHRFLPASRRLKLIKTTEGQYWRFA